MPMNEAVNVCNFINEAKQKQMPIVLCMVQPLIQRKKHAHTHTYTKIGPNKSEQTTTVVHNAINMYAQPNGTGCDKTDSLQCMLV